MRTMPEERGKVIMEKQRVHTVKVPVTICEVPEFNRDGTMEGPGEFVLEFEDVVEALENELDLSEEFTRDYRIVAVLEMGTETGTVLFFYRRRGAGPVFVEPEKEAKE